LSATDPAELRGNATDKMMRLIAKHALQFRRHWPYHEMLPHMENWATMHVRDLPHEALKVLRGPNFRVDWRELRETSVCDRRDVVDMGRPSSMILPLWSRSAVGGTWVADELAMVRRVVAISFPQLCMELMGQYTARTIEAAWERFPIVSRRRRRARRASGSAVGDHWAQGPRQLQQQTQRALGPKTTPGGSQALDPCRR